MFISGFHSKERGRCLLPKFKGINTTLRRGPSYECLVLFHSLEWQDQLSFSRNWWELHVRTSTSVRVITQVLQILPWSYSRDWVDGTTICPSHCTEESLSQCNKSNYVLCTHPEMPLTVGPAISYSFHEVRWVWYKVQASVISSIGVGHLVY